MLLALSGAPPALAQAAGGDGAPALELRPVRDGIYLLAGDAGNVVVSGGEDGLLVVDTGAAGDGGGLLEALQRLEGRLAYVAALDGAPAGSRAAAGQAPAAEGAAGTGPSIRYIVNTGPGPAQTGGNAALVAATGAEAAVPVIAHENALVRLVDAGLAFDMLPTHTVAGGRFDLSAGFNGEAVRLVHLPAATTDGDLLVHFRGSDVICAGAVLSMASFPVIDVARGGSIDGTIRALNRILTLAAPGPNVEGGTLIVPAQGRLADSADVGRYRDMLSIIRDQIQYAIDAGSTLAQIQASDPTVGFDGRFGTDTGGWTTAMFVEAVYRSLVQRP